MPHKRNPELTERVCGLARLIRGYSLTAMENVALWHERDISHSSAERLVLPDSCLALDYILDLFRYVTDGMRVYPQRMWHNLESTRGIVFSQRVLLALVEKGLSREAAYQIVKDNSMRCWEEELDFRQLMKASPDVCEHLSANELEGLFDYGYYLRYTDESFERAGLLQREVAAG
jgi:adenylosuccinate lyase